MERQVYEYFAEIEAAGGVLPGIQQGFFQREIASAAYQYQREMDDDERIIVGVNDFCDPEEKIAIPILRIDPQGYERQVARLHDVRRERDAEAVSARLDALAVAAAGDDNLMPPILEAVRAYATLGEITQVLRQVFGVYHEPTFI
jgi:methylmalonyl-CoA mutase N-terminal domain/subunit